MATGFTWDTQNRETDTAACLAVREHAKKECWSDPTLNMVLLDEITYMVAYDYLLNAVLDALKTALHIRR